MNWPCSVQNVEGSVKRQISAMRQYFAGYSRLIDKTTVTAQAFARFWMRWAGLNEDAAFAG